MTWGDLRKPSATARKITKNELHERQRNEEDRHKRLAKRRDSYRCRFTLCGCEKLKLALEARLESSHDRRHKGMGGNPSGDRSTASNLITLCRHRHQDGRVSRTKGTLRTVYLTDQGCDGIVAWEIDLDALPSDTPLAIEQIPDGRWFEVAREKSIRRWEPFTWQQARILETLAEMDL